MTPLSALIKDQLQLLTEAEVRDFLLSHLDEQASSLRQLFCKQIAHDDSAASAVLQPEPLPAHMLVLAIVYAYAPTEVACGLAQRLGALPQLFTEKDRVTSDKLVGAQHRILADYRCTRSLLAAIKANHSELINLLAAADAEQLSALTRLCSEPELNELFAVMLINNSSDFVAINKQKLIALIRQPQFNNQLQLLLATIESELTVAHSLAFLFTAFIEHADAKAQLKQLNTYLEDHSYALDWQVMQLACSYYQSQLQGADTIVKELYLELILNLLDTMDRAEQQEWLGRFDAGFLLALIDLCLLTSLTQQSAKQQRGIESLLLLCTSLNRNDVVVVELMSSRLSYVDNYLFSNQEQLAAACSLLDCDAHELIIAQNQLQILLTTPAFVSRCTAADLMNLCQRYALLALLQSGSKQEFPQAIPIMQALERIEAAQLASEFTSHLIAKKYHLLQFSMNCRIQELGQNLTANCYAAEVDLHHAIKALCVFNDYYQLIYPSLRRDLALRPIIFACQQPDMAMANELISQLAYVTSTEQHPASEHIALYDNTQSCIGFLDQNNNALTFVEHGLLRLADYHPHRVHQSIYTASGVLLGQLSTSSTLINQPFDSTISASLLAHLFHADLPFTAIDTLGKDVLRHHSLDCLFRQEAVLADYEQHTWLEHHMTKLIAAQPSLLSEQQIPAVLEHYSNSGLFALLWQLSKEPRALLLFEQIIASPDLCEQAFQAVYCSQLQQFIEGQGLILCFATYLCKSHKSHWAIGLNYFAEQGLEQGSKELLGNTLNYLQTRAVNSDAAGLEYQQVLNELSKYAALVLERFCQQNVAAVVLHEPNSELAYVSQCWNKEQLLNLLDGLNKIPDWNNNAQYSLALHILSANYGELFHSHRLTNKLGTKELAPLVFFICRHVACARTQDPDFRLGYRILGELVSYLALSGQMDLFYVQDRYNSKMAQLSLPKEAVPQVSRSNLSQSGSLQIALPECQSLLALHLLHYSGASQPVSTLIKRYLTDMCEPQNNLHTLSSLMTELPFSDLSALIFAELKLTLVTQPQLLDKTLFVHLASYLATNKPGAATAYAAELALLRYFGQNKHYDLVLAGCRLLGKMSFDPVVCNEIAGFALEATVEARLSASQDSFYFPLLQFFVRLWHYGWAGIARVTPCDEPALELVPLVVPAELTAACQRQAIIDPNADFVQKRAQFIKLLARIKSSPTYSSLTSTSCDNGQALFASTERESISLASDDTAHYAEVVYN